MWICEKCNEENEDNFDTCWSCLTFFEERVIESKEHQQKIKEEDQRISEEKNREASINKELDKKGIQIWSVAFFSGCGIFVALVMLDVLLQLNAPRLVLVATAYYPVQKIKNNYKKSLRKKIIEELDNEISIRK